MTKAKRWPNNAIEQRNQSAEKAVEILRTLSPFINEDNYRPTQLELIRRTSKAYIAAQRIITLMREAGAPISVEDLP
jgi:hypothetical protein